MALPCLFQLLSLSYPPPCTLQAPIWCLHKSHGAVGRAVPIRFMELAHNGQDQPQILRRSFSGVTR